MSVPVDIKLTNNRSFEKSPGGDLATVDGQEGVNQDIVARIINGVEPETGRGITREFITEFTADIEDAISDSEFVEEPIDATVTDIEGDTLTLSISTAEREFTVTRDMNATN